MPVVGPECAGRLDVDAAEGHRIVALGVDGHVRRDAAVENKVRAERRTVNRKRAARERQRVDRPRAAALLDDRAVTRQLEVLRPGVVTRRRVRIGRPRRNFLHERQRLSADVRRIRGIRRRIVHGVGDPGHKGQRLRRRLRLDDGRDELHQRLFSGH